jgi:lipopolysaccharide assembly outer membrane protein LptD (OstA)
MKPARFILWASLILLSATVAPAQEARPTRSTRSPADGVQIRAPRFHFTCRTGKCVETYTGEVEVRVGSDLLQADRVIRYKAEGRLIAEGNVVFLRGAERRTGSSLEWDYQSGQIINFDATGFKGRKAKPLSTEGGDRLAEAIKRAYDLPGELLRKDAEALNQSQTDSSLTRTPPACPKGKPR